MENIFLRYFWMCRLAKEGQFCRRCNVIFSLNFEQNVADLLHHIGN